MVEIDRLVPILDQRLAIGLQAYPERPLPGLGAPDERVAIYRSVLPCSRSAAGGIPMPLPP